MKLKNIVMGVCFFAGACSYSHAISQPSASAENIKIGTEWISLLNRHDSIRLAILYSENAQVSSPNWEGTKEGRTEIRAIYGRYFSSTPDLRYILSDIITTDTAIVLEYEFYGTLSAPEPSTPAYMKGKKYSLKGCTVMHVRNGMITKQEFYFDQLAFLRQMGFFEQK
ncbi:MAG: nuclear transport factor 2 family protein [Bacteroidetes bacterium]|nr:nuclear transport factor 2 family protein [Bacteroidota bacterium]